MSEPTTKWCIPTEQETVRLIEESTSNGMAVDLCFGPRGAWIEWNEGEPEPWMVGFIRKIRGLPLIGCAGDGI